MGDGVMVKRIVLILVSLLVAAASLSAAPRFFLGVSFNYDANVLAPALAEKFETLEGIYNDGNITGLQTIGPKFELVIFPFGEIPLGFGVNSATMLTVGYMSGGTHGYFSRKQDFRQDVGVSLMYQQAFGNAWGLFMDCGLSYSWYRVATTNKANSKGPVDYIRFTDWGLVADFGAYLENDNTYFKVGGVFYYDLGYMEKFAFRYGLTLGGGVLFG